VKTHEWVSLLVSILLTPCFISYSVLAFRNGSGLWFIFHVLIQFQVLQLMALSNVGLTHSSWTTINSFNFAMLKMVKMPETFADPCFYKESYRDSEAFQSCSFIQNLPEVFFVMNFSLFIYLIMFYIK